MKIKRLYEKRTETPNNVGEYLVDKFIDKSNIRNITSLDIFDDNLGFKQIYVKIEFSKEITGKQLIGINKMLEHLLKNNYCIEEWFHINAYIVNVIYVSFVINYDKEVEKIKEEAELYLNAKKYNL